MTAKPPAKSVDHSASSQFMPSPTANLASALPFGIGLADDDEISKRLESMELSSNKTNTKVLADKVDALIGMMQQLHVTTRDNNAILNQLLSKVEERINARINDVRQEMLDLINSKLGAGPTVSSLSTHPSFVDKSRRVSIAGEKPPAGRKPTLMKIFDNIDSMNPNTANVSSNSFYETIQVTPLPGFIIKTRKLLGNKDKVFVNVFHHEHIEVEPVGVSKAGADNRPYLVVGDVATILDKDGHNCYVYNVAISSEYFKQDNRLDLKITSPSCIQKILHKINLKFNEFLDESSYVLPRSTSGFKGESVPQFSVCVPVKSVTPLPSPVPAQASLETSRLESRGSHGNLRGSIGSAPRRSFLEAAEPDGGDAESIVSELTGDVQLNTPSSVPQRHGSLQTDRTSLDSHTNGGQWETASTASKSTNLPPKARKVMRKSFFDTSQLAISEGNVAGRNLLTSDMLTFIKEESVDNHTAEGLKAASAEDPNLLLGWQVSLAEENKRTEIFVVTGVRKNYLSRTEFRVSRFGVEDAWVRLKRVAGKTGLEFRPMRKVLFGLAEDGESVA